MRTHLLIASAIFLVCGTVYSLLAATNYCGFDDTLELQRLSFQDPGTLSADFATVLFKSYKYRPLSFTLNRLTYQLGGHRARLFRLRNVISHLLVAVFLYGIGYLLFHSRIVAAAGALLFGLHPLANQTIAGGIWVITPADMLLMLSFFLFLLSLHKERYGPALVAASIAVGSLGVLIYDPVIVIYGLTYLYLLVWIFLRRKPAPGKAYFAVLLGLTVLLLAPWFMLRAHYMPPGAQTPAPIKIIARNLAIYVAGPLQLIDPVFASNVFDTPLPSEALRGDVTPALIAVIALPALVLLILFVSRARKLRDHIGRDDLANFVFLLLAWGGSLTPYLMFNEHPSETYNYVGLGMILLIFSRLLYAAFYEDGTLGSRRLYTAILVVMALLFASGTWAKNSRVYSCGQTMETILASLPADKLQQGKWHVLFANVPDEPATRLYGMYGYKGVDTLGIGEYGSPGIAGALQHRFNNPAIEAETVSAENLPRLCGGAGDRTLCFWVHSDGRVEDATPKTGR